MLQYPDLYTDPVCLHFFPFLSYINREHILCSCFSWKGWKLMLHLTTQNFDICRMNHWQFSSDTPTKAGSEHPTLAVVMFYAVWCGKCAMMRPVIEDLEKKYQKKYFGSICFFEVETSESALLAAQYQTALLPAFLIFKDRELIATMQGMIPQKELDLRLQELLTVQMRTQSTENL